jgi:hypothetical protein
MKARPVGCWLSPLRFCEELIGFLRSQFLSPRQFVIFFRIFVFPGVFGFLGFLWLCHHHRGRASLGRIGLAGRNDMERPRHWRGGIEPGVGDAPPTLQVTVWLGVPVTAAVNRRCSPCRRVIVSGSSVTEIPCGTTSVPRSWLVLKAHQRTRIVVAAVP